MKPSFSKFSFNLFTALRPAGHALWRIASFARAGRSAGQPAPGRWRLRLGQEAWAGRAMMRATTLSWTQAATFIRWGVFKVPLTLTPARVPST